MSMRTIANQYLFGLRARKMKATPRGFDRAPPTAGHGPADADGRQATPRHCCHRGPCPFRQRAAAGEPRSPQRTRQPPGVPRRNTRSAARLVGDLKTSRGTISSSGALKEPSFARAATVQSRARAPPMPAATVALSNILGEPVDPAQTWTPGKVTLDKADDDSHAAITRPWKR